MCVCINGRTNEQNVNAQYHLRVNRSMKRSQETKMARVNVFRGIFFVSFCFVQKRMQKGQTKSTSTMALDLFFFSFFFSVRRALATGSFGSNVLMNDEIIGCRLLSLIYGFSNKMKNKKTTQTLYTCGFPPA